MATNLKVDSSDVAKRFGYYCDEALRAPVTIARRGQDRFVLCTVEEFQRLSALDHIAVAPWELSDEDRDAIANAEYPADQAHLDELDYTKAR